MTEITGSSDGDIAIGSWNDQFVTASEPGRPTSFSTNHSSYGLVELREQQLRYLAGEFVSQDISVEGEGPVPPVDYEEKSLDMLRDVSSNRRELRITHELSGNCHKRPVLFSDVEGTFECEGSFKLTGSFPWMNSASVPSLDSKVLSEKLLSSDLYEQGQGRSKLRFKEQVEQFFSSIQKAFNLWLPVYVRWHDRTTTIGFFNLTSELNPDLYRAKVVGQVSDSCDQLKGFSMRYELVVDGSGEPLLRGLNSQASKQCAVAEDIETFFRG